MTRRVLCHLICLLATFLLKGIENVHAQNFSNKGKEFWVCFPVHIDGTAAKIQLFLTSDVRTYVWIDIPGTGLYINGAGNTSAAPTVFTIDPSSTLNKLISVPVANSAVYLDNVPGTTSNKAIRIRTLSPVHPPFVAYAHIYSSNQSDATLILPVTTLGREHYAFNYTQNPHCLNVSGDPAGCGGFNPGPQRSSISVMAVEPGNTTVEFTLPPGLALNAVSPTPSSNVFTVTLAQGQIYQLLSGSTGNRSNTIDITGTRIATISNTPGQCKKIAVYTGSSRVVIGGGSCTTPGSGDNLFEIMYPTSTWGRNFVIPQVAGRNGNGAYSIIRIMASKANTSIVVNGGTPVVKNAGEFHTVNTNTVTSITADKAISVAQYYTSQNGCGGSGQLGDPAMVMWSPLEQTLKNITLYASFRDNINQSYVSVVTKTSDTSKFKLDGVKIPFTVVPSNPVYSYANPSVVTATLTATYLGVHDLKSDSGFIAVSYGWGQFESYGYSSGANVKNLNQFITMSVDSGCVGDGIQFKGTALYTPSSWKWYFGDGTTANTQNAVKSYTNSGRYDVSLVTTIPGGSDCDSQDSTSVEFTINAKPVANFAWQKNCVNDTIRFSDSSNTATSFVNKWYWQFGDGVTSTQKNPKHKYATHGTYQVKLKIFNEGGCDDSITKSVTIYPSPKANFYTPQHCIADSFSFMDSSTIATGGVINFWKWKFGTGDSSMTQYPKYKFISEGIGNINLVVQSDFGCRDSVTKSVSIDPTPDAKLWSQSVCRNDSAVFLDSSSIVAGGTITSWVWKFGDGDSSILTNPKHKYASPGTYTYRLTVTSDKACWDTASASLQVYTLPAAGFKPTTVCNKDSIHFEDQSLGGGTGTPSQWAWDFGDGSSVDTLNKPVHYYVNAGPYQVKMIVTNNFGCRDTITKMVKVYPKPKASFTIGILCNIDTSFFINKSSISSGNLSYFWNFGDTTTTSTSINPVHVYTKSTTYQVLLVAKSDSGCVDTVITPVLVNGKPKADFTAPTCPEDSVIFTNLTKSSDAIINQSWNFGDGGTSNIKDAKHLYSAEGTYNVKLVVYSAFCKDSLNKSVTVSFKPKADFSMTPVCEYDTAKFTDQSQVYVSTLNSWAWDFGDLRTSTQQNPSNKYTLPTAAPASDSFAVRLIVGAATGCFDTITKMVHIFPKPYIAFNLAAPCYTDSAVFASTSSVITGTVQSYLWNFGDGGSDTRANPKHQYLTSNTYVVQLTATSDKGCSTTVSNNILINPPPMGDFTFRDTCVNDTVQFEDLSTTTDGSISGWRWDFGNGKQDTVKMPRIAYASPATYPVKLTLITSSGCTYVNYINKNIVIYDRPKVSFTADPDSTNILFTKITFTNPTNAIKFDWDFGDTTYSSETNPEHNYQDTGRFVVKLVATSSFGCKDSTTGRVIISPAFSFFIPTAFSPNEDGSNEVFYPMGEGWKTFELTIYNRWGQTIFEGKPNEAWLGTYNNKIGDWVQDGVYPYMVKVIDQRGKKKYFSGEVTLLR